MKNAHPFKMHFSHIPLNLEIALTAADHICSWTGRFRIVPVHVPVMVEKDCKPAGLALYYKEQT